MFGGPLAQVWDLSTGNALGRRVVVGRSLQFADFNPGGDSVISWSKDAVAATIWDAVSGKELLSLKHDFQIQAAVFSHDGRRLIVCSADNSLSHCYAQVWDTGSGLPIGSRLNHGDGVLCASFTQDGNRVVTGGEDFKAKVWDTSTSRVLTVVTHEHQINGVAFSSDAAWFATASADKTACVWSSETGDPLAPPLRHHTKLTDVKFLADNRSIVTSDDEGHAWIWKLPSSDRPAPELTKLSQLLAGRTTTVSGGLNSSDPQSLQDIWKQLRADQPLLFAAPDDAIAAWYEFQAEESELANQWPAAVFHLEHLLQMRPADSSLAQRLARAKAQGQSLKSSRRP
jgi:WD40 repeat protein